MDAKARLPASLEDIRRTRLDLIAAEQAREVVRDVIKRGTSQVPVEVARFGSSI